MGQSPSGYGSGLLIRKTRVQIPSDPQMKLHKKNKGTLGELLIAADLISKGYSVFTELGDNSKVDLIAIDKNYNLIKIQVKSYTSKKDVVVIHSTKDGPGYHFKYKLHHFDVCAVYVLDYKQILYITSKQLLKKKACLNIRLKPAKNKQKARTHNYQDFLSFEAALPSPNGREPLS